MVKPKIEMKTQIRVFKKYYKQIFDEDGNVLPCSNSIYDVLIEKLNGMSKKALQMSIKRYKNIILADKKDQVSALGIGKICARVYLLIFGFNFSFLCRVKSMTMTTY